MFIDRMYRINHTETWYLNAPRLVTSPSHKIVTKMRYSTSKDTAFDGKTTLRHTFLCSDSQCLPPWRSQNPVRITWVSDQWKIIHYVPDLFPLLLRSSTLFFNSLWNEKELELEPLSFLLDLLIVLETELKITEVFFLRLLFTPRGLPPWRSIRLFHSLIIPLFTYSISV